MSDEIKLAFSHPEDRAAATNPTGLDRISVRDFVMDAEIGAFQVERDITQRIRFNIVVEVAPVVAPLDDDVDRILSYDKITEAVEHEMASERLNLLETLADRIAARILNEPQAERVFIRIEKLDRGPATLGVEIVRVKEAGALVRTLKDTPHPIVVHLSNAEFEPKILAGWLDIAERHKRPFVFCVGPADIAILAATTEQAQHHINLLAIEQNAWVLAGLDERCRVVETRTELDWGMRNDQISVWAPSKMVLDAVDGPSKDPSALDLTSWFATQIEAVEAVTTGATEKGLPDNMRLAKLSDFAA